MKTTIVGCALLLGCAAFAVLGSPARAATEFCPATLTGPYNKPNDVNVHYYRLRAFTPRAVEGTIIADTNRGWFTWTQQWVSLTRMTFTTISPGITYRSVMAESPELSVAFPAPVEIARAWVVAAETHGDTALGWDARGRASCEPPDSSPTSPADHSIQNRTPAADDPTPAPAPPLALAAPAKAPFPPANCDHPFTSGRVENAVVPQFPAGFGDPAFHGVTTILFVAVNSSGELVDAWVDVSSGYPALDVAAIEAAARSTYAAPIVYCRAVSGTYLFRADFLP
jgi:hypothetical protein